MALAALVERVTSFLPQPDPAMQKRIERSMPLRAELLHQIRSVWVVLLACQGAALLWLRVTPLQFALATLFPALFLLFAFSKSKPFASAQLFVSIVLALTMTMGFDPYPQSGGTGVLTIILAGLLVGEFFVGIWTFVISVGLLATMTGSSDWRVNLGWAAVNVIAGWLVILFSRNLERLLDANFTAEEQQRGAIVEERTRFAREIHDTLAQGFTGIMMQLNAAEQRLQPGAEALGYIETARGLAQESLDQARRSVSALRMGVLANSTLLEAIEQIGKQMVAESKIKFETRLEGAPYPLTEPREANLLRIAQEVLTNAVRHSGADRIVVRLAYSQGSTVLEIEDNGRGMGDQAGCGFGVDGIQERVRQLGGQPTFAHSLIAVQDSSSSYRMPEPIRILIADDHDVVRDGSAAVLEFQPDMTVVGHAKNGREAVARFRELKPDVALMDLAMPELDGSGAIIAIRAEFPYARILVLTTYSGDESVFRALENGAKGYLLKDCSTADLLGAIRTIHAGGAHVSAPAGARLAERAMGGAALSPREIEVLNWIAAGKSNKEIAALLFISEGTVKTHVLSIHEKLGVSDRTEAVVKAIKRGILRI